MAVAGVDANDDGDFDDDGDTQPVEAVAAVPWMGAGSVIQKIVTSPNYSSDGFVAFVFNTADENAGSNDNSGLCYSSDEGEAWDCYNGTDTGGSWATVKFYSLTLEPGFSGDGDMVLAGDGGVFRIDTDDLGSMTEAETPVRAEISEVALDGGDCADAMTLDVSYTPTSGPKSWAGSSPTTTPSTASCITTPGLPAGPAMRSRTANQIPSPTSPLARSVSTATTPATATSTFAAVSGTADGNENSGGVFLFGGSTWEELTDGERDCDGGYDSLSVAGEDGDTILVGSMSGSSKVCSSDDEGDDWSDTSLGGSSCAVCKIDSGDNDVTMTRVALNREDPDSVYWTSAGMLSAVFSSSNGGGSFQEANLTNLAYATGSPNERSTSMAFAMGTAPNDMDALFRTNNYGGNAEWQRVLRYDGSDLSLVSPSSDFATAATMYAVLAGADKDPVLKSTNGGVSWDETSADPFDDSDEDDELIKNMSQRSANTLVAGGTKGTIAITTDGGSTWTNIDPDSRSNGPVDEIDFISGTTVYVVTLENARSVYTPLLTTDGGATFAEIGDAGNAWGKGGKITYRNESFDGTTGKALVIINGASSNGIWRYDADAASPKWSKVQSGSNWSSGFSVGASGIGDGRAADPVR